MPARISVEYFLMYYFSPDIFVFFLMFATAKCVMKPITVDFSLMVRHGLILLMVPDIHIP